MSSRPKRFTAAATIAATSASLATSHRTKAMSFAWPWALATARVSAPLASLRSATMTFAPSARNRMTVARPMPLAPPVTIATLPSSRFMAFRPPNAWWSCASAAASLAFRIGRRPGNEIRPVLRDFDPASVDAGEGADRLQQLPRAGEAGRRSGLRSRMGGRASFPRGVLPLFRARVVPARLRPGDQAHPGRPRYRRLRSRIQSSDQDCREDGDPGHLVRRPPACRHGPFGDLDRARRIPCQSGYDQEELGRVRALSAQDVDAGDLRLSG